MKNILLFFVLLFAVAELQSATLYSRATGNWGAGNTWSTASCGGASCLCIPSLSTDIINLCGAYTVTVASSYANGGTVNLSAGTLLIPAGITLTVVNLNMTGGTLTVNGTLNITGSITKSGGTFTPAPTTTGTVGYTGPAQNVLNGITYYNLNIAGFGNKTLAAGTTTVYNQLLLTSNNLIIGSNTLQVGGATWGHATPISVSSGQLDITSGTSNLSIGGGASSNFPTLSSWFSSAAPWTLASLTIMRNIMNIVADGNLTITGAFTTYNGGTSMGGNLKINPGVLVTFNGPVNMNRTCACNEVTGSSTSDIIIGGLSGQPAAIYFDLGSIGIGGTNTIRNFTLNRTGMTFYPLSSLRIGNLLTLAAGTKFSVANNIGGISSLNTLTFDGVGNSWTGTGVFVGSSDLTSAYIYIYGSGALNTPLTFATTTAANYTLTGLELQRSGSPILQLGTNLNILSFINFKPSLSTYGSLDINGKIIDLGNTGAILNENTSESIFCSACPANSTASYIAASHTLASSTSYDNTTDTRSGDTGLRGLGLDILTTATAPGLTTIKRGFSVRSGGELSTSVLRYFEISPATNSGLSTTLTFHYWDSEDNGLTESDNVLYRDNTGINDWVERGGISTPSAGDNIVALSGIDAFSSWTAGKKSGSMPVEVLMFNGFYGEKEITLSWSTATETNNDYFTIEKSINAEDWVSVGTVDGAGNSNEVINYAFEDAEPMSGTSYYRLKQTDFDGKFEYFGPVSVNCSEGENGIIAYPNPAQENVLVVGSQDVAANIYLCDLTGRIIEAYSCSRLSEPFSIDLQNILPGIYLIRVDSQNSPEYFRVVKE